MPKKYFDKESSFCFCAWRDKDIASKAGIQSPQNQFKVIKGKMNITRSTISRQGLGCHGRQQEEGRLRKGGWVGFLVLAEAPCTRTFSWSSPTSVAIAIFAQTLTSTLAQTSRDLAWVAKEVPVMVLCSCIVCFTCAQLCLLLRPTFQYRVARPCCAVHVFDDILSSAVKYLWLFPFFLFFLGWNTAFHFTHPPTQTWGNKISISK